MPIYQCDRCLQTFSQKSNYEKHQQRKFPCQPVYKNDATLKKIIEEMIDNKLNELTDQRSVYYELFNKFKIIFDKEYEQKENNIEIIHEYAKKFNEISGQPDGNELLQLVQKYSEITYTDEVKNDFLDDIYKILYRTPMLIKYMKEITQKIDLNKMTLFELKTYCKENNIYGYNNKNKDDLIAFINETFQM